MSEKRLDEATLAQFTGSYYFYRHPLMPSICYTEGAQYVAENAGAYWLLDLIVSCQLIPEVRIEEFQAWKLTVHENSSAVIVCEDGNENVVYTQGIPWTDFPLPKFELWFENDTIYIPSER